MFLIPAIDIKDGKCVRVAQGDLSTAKVYYEDPVDAARHFADLGFDWIHVVDLDAAVSGKVPDVDLLVSIKRVGDVHVEFGGGVRDESIIRNLLGAGLDRVVVGTLAARAPDLVSGWIEEFPKRVVVGLDARDGKVAVKGWTEDTMIGALDLARYFDKPSTAAIIYTDIARDGMQTGVNIEATRELAQAVSVPVIASGGIDNLEQVKELAAAPEPNLIGVISGRAVYEGTLDLAEAAKIAKAG
ncbi:MAG: 1-(5-phosphoribosyl)-5-[(5-phosphoribosylamino)methylideneamino]imidazole-4-carboxamide isomerase [Deltaproteobacteria bacterium]|nr:1-(5-phosphoribosyl)-5-[(5-phosphoribosylamino)methylideneamino]imidazole-4-carboxamide isomerase [Deltaproteobacteria bacterium]